MYVLYCAVLYGFWKAILCLSWNNNFNVAHNNLLLIQFQRKGLPLVLVLAAFHKVSLSNSVLEIGILSDGMAIKASGWANG